MFLPERREITRGGTAPDCVRFVRAVNLLGDKKKETYGVAI